MGYRTDVFFDCCARQAVMDRQKLGHSLSCKDFQCSLWGDGKKRQRGRRKEMELLSLCHVVTLPSRCDQLGAERRGRRETGQAQDHRQSSL